RLGLCCWLAVPLSLAAALIRLDTKPGEPTAVVYRHARLLTAAGAPIEDGALVVRDGKIVAVGPSAEVKAPDGALTIDLTGKVVIPGLVDTPSHLGLWSRPNVPANSDGNDGGGPVQPALRALDAITPDDPGFRMAVAGGITTANIMPGSGNVIGGATLYLKLRGPAGGGGRGTPPRVPGGAERAHSAKPQGTTTPARKTPPPRPQHARP